MTTRRRMRVDQLTVQEAIRIAARRCIVWAKQDAAGRVDPRDQRFAEELVHLVRRHERALPTAEPRLRASDRGLDGRLAAAVAEISAIVKQRKAKFRKAAPGKVMFHQIASVLRLHGFEVLGVDVERAFWRKVSKSKAEEEISDLAKDFSGSAKEAARFCVSALQLDAGVSVRNQHLRSKRAQLPVSAERVVSLDELARFLMVCCALGPRTANLVAGVVVTAYRQGRLDPRFAPARELLGGFFAEPVRPRAAYPRRARGERTRRG